LRQGPWGKLYSSAYTLQDWAGGSHLKSNRVAFALELSRCNGSRAWWRAR
jgi:hypothetical protein